MTPAVARTFAKRYTVSEIQELQDTCLQVYADSGEVTKSFGSGSISIRRENCQEILEDLEEALSIKMGGGVARDISGEAPSSALNYAPRPIE